MQNNILNKTPLNSRNTALYKNHSYRNIFQKSDDKIIYKIRERLYNPKSLSILSSNRNNSNFNSNINIFKTNYINMMKNLISKDIDLNDEKNLGIKSFNNLSTNIKNLNALSIKKNFFDKKKFEGKKHDFKIPNLLNYEKSYRIIQTPLSEQKNFLNEKKDNSSSKFIDEKKTEGQNKNVFVNLKLVNRILKLNRTKYKDKIIKDLLPMKLDKNYDEFIQRKLILNYNPNFNSPNYHFMSLNYMLEKLAKNNLRKHSSIQSRIKLEKNKKEKKIKLERELAQEMLDKFEDIPVDFYKIKKSVKIFFSDETKLNQISEVKEKFFDVFENKINFLYDCLRLPVLKNHLHREIIFIQVSKDNEWSKLNSLENCTLVYLNKLKFRYQKELDEIKEEDKDKKFKLYQDVKKYEEKNNIKDIEESHTSIEYILNIIKNEAKNQMEIKEEKDENKYISEKEDLYNLQEFFVNKSSPYKKIDFANEKLSHIIFHNKKFSNLDSKKVKQVKFDYKISPNVYI